MEIISYVSISIFAPIHINPLITTIKNNKILFNAGLNMTKFSYKIGCSLRLQSYLIK